MSGDVKNGDGNATFTLGAGINTGMTARLSRLVARVSVSGIRTEFDPNGQYSAASYELKNIFVRNAVKEAVPGTGGYSTTKMSTPDYLTGNYTGSSGTVAYLANSVTPPVSVGTEHKTDYWFYILPNEEATRTALVLEGTFKKSASDAGTIIYYPISSTRARPEQISPELRHGYFKHCPQHDLCHQGNYQEYRDR